MTDTNGVLGVSSTTRVSLTAWARLTSVYHKHIQAQFNVRRSESQASDNDEVNFLGITCEFLPGRK